MSLSAATAIPEASDFRRNAVVLAVARDAHDGFILALVTAMYEAAIVKARRCGSLDPRLFILMDEAANIAPVRTQGGPLAGPEGSDGKHGNRQCNQRFTRDHLNRARNHM